MEVPDPLPPVLKRPPAPEVEASKALSLLARPGDVGIRTRRIAIVVADGVHATSAVAVYARLAEAGAVPRFVGPRLGTVKPAVGRPIDVEATLTAMPAVLFDALVLPDGESAVQALSKDGHALDFIRDQFRHSKPILILGESIALLDAIGVPRDAPGLVQGSADTEGAIARFVKLVEKHRAFERETDPPAV